MEPLLLNWLHGLTLITEWVSNYIQLKAWYEITYSFQNFKGATVEVWYWIGNFIQHFIDRGLTYPLLDEIKPC